MKSNAGTERRQRRSSGIPVGGSVEGRTHRCRSNVRWIDRTLTFDADSRICVVVIPTIWLTMAAPDGMASAVAGFSKLGIKPEMITKAVTFLFGYLKKCGGAAVASLLGVLFKGAGTLGTIGQ